MRKRSEVNVTSGGNEIVGRADLVKRFEEMGNTMVENAAAAMDDIARAAVFQGTILPADQLEAVVSEPGMAEKKWDAIVRKIVEIDVEKEFAKLDKAIEPDPQRSEFAIVYRYADACEHNARMANVLYQAARFETRKVEFEAERVLAPMRSAATDVLSQKVEGVKQKSITNVDVRAKMIELHYDEVNLWEERILKAQSVEDHLREFASIWKHRCETAKAMLSVVRR